MAETKRFITRTTDPPMLAETKQFITSTTDPPIMAHATNSQLPCNKERGQCQW